MPESMLRWPSWSLGLALGGFFDGILLHQILQWHHLLSSVDAVPDMRGQLLADGLFHALMYVVATLALGMLWRRRAALNEAGSGPLLGGTALLGFGTWHVLDAVLSHWLLGIHRIKMDAVNPLMWDLLWVVGFGVVPLLLGWFVLRSRQGGGPIRGRAAATSLTMAALLAGTLAAVPIRSSDQTVVLFAPSVSPGAAMNALARADARIVWVDRTGGLWAVRMTDRSAAWRLYLDGALLVGHSGAALGCIAWTRAR